jgi:hypothetical protein
MLVPPWFNARRWLAAATLAGGPPTPLVTLERSTPLSTLSRADQIEDTVFS